MKELIFLFTAATYLITVFDGVEASFWNNPFGEAVRWVGDAAVPFVQARAEDAMPFAKGVVRESVMAVPGVYSAVRGSKLSAELASRLVDD